ncbi:hypothetical protein ACTXJR_06985 [Glutamicibacter ardleyensis]|uniref:hypothetical protein n=1 Tax=Glutamicibacter ardleyensis TaxID=225894 RepID=UPI003FD3FE5B
MANENEIVVEDIDHVDAGADVNEFAPVIEDENPEEGLKGLTEEQNREAEQFATVFMKKILRLRGVRIDRPQFLKAELHKRGFSPEQITGAIEGTPAGSGIPISVLDDIARSAIDFETRKSTSLSFFAGLPGGFAMIGTIPADITQFYVHAFRVMQKLAYVYGWQSFLQDAEDIDDETLGLLATFLGVMMKVGGASASLNTFAARVAAPAIERNIARVALSKTLWYTPMKKTLRIIGINITKQSFAKSVSKVVPVVGGVISGGMTFVVLGSQSQLLQKHLRMLPPPNVDAAAYLRTLAELDLEIEGKKSRVSVALDNAGLSAREAASGTVDFFRAVDLDGDGIPDEARAKTSVKKAMSSVKTAVSRSTGKSNGGQEKAEADSASAPGSKLRGFAENTTGKFKSKFASKRSDKQIAKDPGTEVHDDKNVSEPEADSDLK